MNEIAAGEEDQSLRKSNEQRQRRRVSKETALIG
jgi:hypothetical protein